VRRGFQAEAERLATEIRQELGLGVDDRFEPPQLALAYGVPVVPITDLVDQGADESAVWQLTITDRGCFSAATVFIGTSRLIVYNPSHSDRRLANSLAHELSHLLLEHEPGPALGPGGCRTWDGEVEAEADALAGMLLISREAALACARVGLPHAVGAARFGVSTELMRWRTDHSGASRQAAAEARRAGRPPVARTAGVLRVPPPAEMAWLGDLSSLHWRLVLRRCGAAVAGGATELHSVLSADPRVASTQPA
jgi:Zn-dependent peptidase ImmA (M78 family)